MQIIKRDGREQNFDLNKLKTSINKAALDININLSEEQYNNISEKCNELLSKENEKISVEKLQDIIEKTLYLCGLRKIKDSYKTYRKERTNIRDTKSTLMKAINAIGIETDRDNANVGNNFSSKLLRIASESNKWTQLANMPKLLAKEYENGDLYYHDLDSFNLTVNCLNVPTGEVLKKGFNTGYGTINRPKRIETAAELSCILLQSTQNDCFGGQSHPNFDNDMAIFVEPTRQEEIKNLMDTYCKMTDYAIGFEIDENDNIKIDSLPENIKVLLEERTKNRIHQAMQGVVYNLNTMHSRAGSQVPFSSVNLGLPENKDAALVCEIFLLEYEKGLGNGEQPIFPNIIFRVKDGVNKKPEDPYYYLFKLACRVASKRMNPTFMNIDADFNKEFYDKGYIPCTMGCRTYVMDNINGEPGGEGRGNIAPTTINLPRLGIRAMKQLDEDIKKNNLDIEKYSEKYIQLVIDIFLNLFNEKIELAKKSLLYRYDILKDLRVKDLPFVAGQGFMKGSEGLSPDDSIEPILKQGTWGIGFIGLAETLTALTGKHHGEDIKSRELGYKIIQHLRNKCDEYKQKYKLNWSCYCTPAEGLSGKFIKQDQKKFGIIKGVTDKDYYTNSVHIPVNYPISIKEKLEIEAPFHKMCNGGHISYIEMDGYPDPDTIENIITYAYTNTNINYIGINFHIRYCKHCGTYLHDEKQCPSCGSYDIQGISRVTGYLSLDERFGPGKVAERKDRTDHNNNHENNYILENK
jgi:ribonucleoside-triphosphate reductase